MKRLAATFLFILVMAISFSVDHTEVKAEDSATFNYKVKEDDTISIIAKKYGVGSIEIKGVNPELDVNNLEIGSKIKIPNMSYIRAFQDQVVYLSNIERQNAGVAPVVSDSNMARVARYKANDMRDTNYFSHYSPTYGDPFVMLSDFGISFKKAGENIAARQTTPEQVVQSWMESESHRTTLLNPDYTRLGVGYSEGGILGQYWVQMFAN